MECRANGLELVCNFFSLLRKIKTCSSAGASQEAPNVQFGEIQCTTCAVSRPPGETITLENGVKAKILEIVQGGSREEMKVKVGVWRTPAEFFDQAKSLLHPFDDFEVLADELKEAVFNKLTHPPKEVAMRRLNVIKAMWLKRLELKSHEEDLKRSLDPDRRGVLKDRQVLLLEHYLKLIGHSDRLEVIGSLVKGVDLTKPVSFSEEFPVKYVPATITAKELRAHAELAQDQIVYTM
eukprot:2247997-Amphidinium_carterae.1